MKITPLLLILLILSWPVAGMDFTLHKKAGEVDGNTLLVVGGIQGDEPGGFNAASLLVTHYQIHKGNVWIVPNLNFSSIISRSRGVYGDMNRKFAQLDRTDPEFVLVSRIKSIILDPEVDLVLNLHDGSGFYRPYHVDSTFSPYRWGQSLIIDQENLASEKFGDLQSTARRVADLINHQLIDADHVFHVKNTYTPLGNVEMAKTLTYFAVRNHIPAFGIEASKEFPTHIRTYYHLLALEAYMREAGIEYSRDFELNPTGIHYALNNNIQISFYDEKFAFDVSNIRGTLNYIPFKKDSELIYQASNPLVAVLGSSDNYRVHYGNNRVTFLQPQYFEYDNSIEGISMLIDGERREIKFGSIVNVDEEFQVEEKAGYRVNVIGFTNKHITNESGITIRKSDIMEQFSVDKDATTFRIEVYKGDRFSGMILASYSGEPLTRAAQRNSDRNETATAPHPATEAPTHLASSGTPELDSR